MGGASVGGGSMGDYQLCNCVISVLSLILPSIPWTRCRRASSCAVVWLSRHFSQRRAALPSDGHQLIKQRQNTVRKVRGVGGGGASVE